VVEPQEKRETTPENLGKPLDPSATRALQTLLADLRDALLVEANRASSDEHITHEDLFQAYKRLSFPSKDSLAFADAQSVISQALRENRTFEWVSTEWRSCFSWLGWAFLARASYQPTLPLV